MKKAFQINADQSDVSRDLCSGVVRIVNYASTYLELNNKINQSSTMEFSITQVYIFKFRPFPKVVLWRGLETNLRHLVYKVKAYPMFF